MFKQWKTAAFQSVSNTTLMIGFLLGALLACGYVTIGFLVDDKYKTAEDIRRYTGLTTLAVVPIEQMGNKKGLGKKK